MKLKFVLSGGMFFLFGIFTLLAVCVDVQPIGPAGSLVGFAAFNQWIFDRIGVHWIWYDITDWLGIIAVLQAFFFVIVGVCQLIRRKSLFKVDRQLWVLGAFYLMTIAFYLFFENVIVNYRPVLMNGFLEASYPSSHTMIVVCIMASAPSQMRSLFQKRKHLHRGTGIAAVVISAVTVIGRMISGVHWFTDILGGLLLSAALLSLYFACLTLDKEKPEQTDICSGSL